MQQAQKLESLGVLAGGIAHDFNNLLMAILGNADLALRELPPGVARARPPRWRSTKAARRAAELCRQMLAYAGRGGSSWSPSTSTRWSQEMVQLLEVSISKKALLSCTSPADLPADRGRRGAAPPDRHEPGHQRLGGHRRRASGVIASPPALRVQCGRHDLRRDLAGEKLAPGRYVFLEVADTGCGMDAETLARIFDPFFTTKFTGRGLGLAAVLGIVRGHRGAIKVYSEPGRGTTLPRPLPRRAARRVAAGGRAGAAEWRGRAPCCWWTTRRRCAHVAAAMLEHCGFTRADAPPTAARRSNLPGAAPAEIVGVILDLTMPHMDGERDLPRAAPAQRRPAGDPGQRLRGQRRGGPFPRGCARRHHRETVSGRCVQRGAASGHRAARRRKALRGFAPPGSLWSPTSSSSRNGPLPGPAAAGEQRQLVATRERPDPRRT